MWENSDVIGVIVVPIKSDRILINNFNIRACWICIRHTGTLSRLLLFNGWLSPLWWFVLSSSAWAVEIPPERRRSYCSHPRLGSSAWTCSRWWVGARKRRQRIKDRADNDWCLSALPDSLIKPINLYAEELSDANGSNLPKQSSIVCVLWREPKLEGARLAASGSWLETAQWCYPRLFSVNGKTITSDGIHCLRGGLSTMLIMPKFSCAQKGQDVTVTLLEWA